LKGHWLDFVLAVCYVGGRGEAKHGHFVIVMPVQILNGQIIGFDI